MRGMREDVVRGVRQALGLRPVYKTVDTCAAEFAATTPYHYSSYDEETEVAPRERGGGHHPRQRPQPHRPGHRVRLLVRARLAGAERGRLRDDHGQLQPRDRLHRLRHLRPALLRAAHPGGRARDRARRGAGRTDRRGHLPARRPDAARAGAGPRRRRREDRRHRARGDPPRRGAGRLRQGALRRRAARPQARHGRRPSRTPSGSPTTSATPCWCARRTSSADAAWRSSTTTAGCAPTSTRPTEISREHPVLVDRFIDDAVEIDVDAIFDGHELFLGGVMEHIEEAGIHSGDSSCALPPITLGETEIDRIRHATEAIARGVGRPGPHQHPVRAELRRALRPRGQPAGQPHGPVRLQGDRDPAGQGRRAGDAGRDHRRPARGRPAARGRRRTPARRRADRGQGGGDAVQPVQDHRRPQRRHRPRARR